MMWVFDGHLDLALNALDWERDQTLLVEALKQREAGRVGDGEKGGGGDHRGPGVSVSLPEMRRGGVRLCCSTLLARAKPWVDARRVIGRDDSDWPSPSMAHAVAHAHLAYYRWLERRGEIRVITDRQVLAEHVSDVEGTRVGVIVTMEGADPITEPNELAYWHGLGLRTLMLAHFGVSHYAGGTPSSDSANVHDVDVPLTDRGRALLGEMEKLGMPLDLTHLSDRSFVEAEQRFGGRIYSSHTACRALVDLPRNHTDEQLRAIFARDGVVGLPLFNHFISAGYTEQTDPDSVSVECLADHVDHLCQLAGSAKHAAIGSDLDGGFGSEHTPRGMDTIADLRGFGEVLAGRGYRDDDIADILHGNWLRFFGECLPDA